MHNPATGTQAGKDFDASANPPNLKQLSLHPANSKIATKFAIVTLMLPITLATFNVHLAAVAAPILALVATPIATTTIKMTIASNNPLHATTGNMLAIMITCLSPSNQRMALVKNQSHSCHQAANILSLIPSPSDQKIPLGTPIQMKILITQHIIVMLSYLFQKTHQTTHQKIHLQQKLQSKH